MAIVINEVNLLLERAAEAMLGRCTRIVHAATPDASSSAITPEYIEQLDHTIRSFATRYLRTIAALPWCEEGGGGSF